jgi:hypothetical protein
LGVLTPETVRLRPDGTSDDADSGGGGYGGGGSGNVASGGGGGSSHVDAAGEPLTITATTTVGTGAVTVFYDADEDACRPDVDPTTPTPTTLPPDVSPAGVVQARPTFTS